MNTLLRRSARVFVAAVMWCGSVPGVLASQPVCRHYADDVLFLGRHIATGTSGVVFDHNPFFAVESGPGDGVAFFETDVEVLSLQGDGSDSEWPAVGSVVKVLQKIPCSRCRPGDAPFSTVSEELWYRAHKPGWNLFINAAAMYGARFDLVIEAPCVPTVEKPNLP